MIAVIIVAVSTAAASGVSRPSASSAPPPASATPAADACSLARTQAELLEALRRAVQPVAAKPSKQLLRAVPEEESSDDDAKQQTSNLHLEAFRGGAVMTLNTRRTQTNPGSFTGDSALRCPRFLAGRPPTLASAPPRPRASAGCALRRRRHDDERAVAAASSPVSNAALVQARDVLRALEERVGGLQEADARRAVVHRHDPARRQALDDQRGLLGADRGPPPTGTNSRSTSPIAAACSSRSAALAEVADVTHAQAVELEHEDRVRARAAVPAASSCSEAIAVTSPSGDCRRARRRAQHVRLAADRLDRVVVAVLVRDEQQIGSTPAIAG